MEYADSKIVIDFFTSNPDFSNPEEQSRYPIAIVVGDYIYVSCYIKTQTTVNYDVIYENNLLKSKKQAFEEDDYWSPFNKGYFAKKTYDPLFMIYTETYCEENENPNITHIGTGAVLVIINKNTLSIHKVYYFKDTYNLDASLEFIDVIEGKVIVRYVEYNYVFEKDHFTFFTFVDSYKYLKLDYLWIAYPSYGYDAFCNWHLINFRENIEQPIYALTKLLDKHPSIQDYSDCWYDFERCKFVFANKTESISMDYETLCIKEEDIHLLRHQNIGSKDGYCSIEKHQIEKKRHPLNELYSYVTSWDSHVGSDLKYKYFYDYYSYNDYKNCATSSMWDTWHTVWNFKNDPAKGVSVYEHESALRKVIELVESTLRSTFGSKTEFLTLVCLTASTQRKTELRFKEFAEKVCSDLNMTNAYPHIHVVEDGSAKHDGGDGSRKVSYESSFFRSKYVVLFDDVRTSGRSLEQERRTLERFGAKVICAITIAQTK